MPVFEAVVEVIPRAGILDPAGGTVERSLPTVGFDGVSGVRIGKSIRLRIERATEAEAAEDLERICSEVLANPVMEDYTFVVSPAGDGS
ncbi:MAG: phosphoribosylformylglycinamidine synthase subunit PurS [Actinobacteria bacterium]|nr:phosphoribosylformylglycinamidine synthase subunit PurS [Actinomycetota bacterium]MCB9390120.1 phosphoribosylformylglycinamidine synthase subunit PurS [Acidimicrobiia bacterium]